MSLSGKNRKLIKRRQGYSMEPKERKQSEKITTWKQNIKARNFLGPFLDDVMPHSMLCSKPPLLFWF